MKTFDEAVEIITNKLENDWDAWKGDNCRCYDISNSEKLEIRYSNMLKSLVTEFNFDLRTISQDNAKKLGSMFADMCKLSIELGIAIGQEMEKE